MYERRSRAVTTNLPFGKWADVFRDATAAAAVIDGIVHHSSAFKTEGGRYRLKDAKQASRRRKAKGRRR